MRVFQALQVACMALSCARMYDAGWFIVFMDTIVALAVRYHHPIYCRHLSSVVVSFFCIGSPADKAIVAIAAYWLPVFSWELW